MRLNHTHKKKTISNTHILKSTLHAIHLVSPGLVRFVSVFGLCVDNLDFENLSNSLFHEWNNFETNAITNDDTKANQSHSNQSPSSKTQTITTTTTASPSSSHRTRIELETIFVRVGLQMSVACRLADEVYNKLGLSADQSICFSDFLTLIGQCHSETDAGKTAANNDGVVVRSNGGGASVDDEYTISPLNDHMIFDMHAPASGLFCSLSLTLLNHL